MSKYGKVTHLGQEISVDDDLLSKIMPLVRASGKADNRFDFNLAEGKIKESELSELIQNGSVEVKRDFMSSKTGNVAVEFMCGGKQTGGLTYSTEKDTTEK